MHYLTEIYSNLTTWASTYLLQISIAFVATLIAIFGEDINHVILRMFRKNFFIVRVLIFVIVCTFGYTTATVFLARLLRFMLRELDRDLLVPALAALFVIIGFLAERRSQT